MGAAISRILVIEENRDGHLWLGTDAGLVKYDPASEQVLKHFTEQEGLSNNFISGPLAEGDTCLWLGTNFGLSRFHIGEESFVNFFEEDGLTHNEFNRVSYLKASDGRMFFGGLRGINAFYPKELMENHRNKNSAAKLVLSSFERVDERVDSTLITTHFTEQADLHLFHHHRSFTFEYALTDFNNPGDISYSYQMEGYENGWSKPSKFNFTRFSSLPAGKYVFRVKARDSRGNWHPSRLAVSVTVHPPWWQTWWAYALYFLAGAGLASGVFYFLKRRWALRHQLLLEQKEALRLKELDSFKSRLYTNLTHEFRTPLTVILGMAGQLNEGSQNLAVPATEKEKLAGGLGLIRRNGQHLLRLINQLLDLSKLENKSFQLNLVQADIVPYLRYLTESFQTFANGQNLSLRFFSTVEKLVMDHDPEQLSQVVANLISNAVKFTPSGGEVSIRLASQNGRLCIEVKDTGIGIPTKDLPHIFDRFFQVESTPSTLAVPGTGIGLAHAQELVKLMGGQISVESSLGKGTCFLVSLPVVREGGEVGSEVRQPVSAMAAVMPPAVPHFSNLTSRPSLLIIEDNPDVVVYLKSCLENNYQIDVAFNGKIGIEKAVETIPDLIVSDVMMPEKDGFEVCHTLKNDERTSHIPIILLTAKTDVASKITGLRTGADAYLSKPFDKEELLVRLEKLAEIRERLRERFSSWQFSVPAPEPQPVPPEKAPREKTVLDLEDAFLQKVKMEVGQEISNSDFNPVRLSRALGLSQSQLYRKMKALTGTTPALFIRKMRLHRGMELLRSTDLNISEVAYEVGFSDPAYFSRTFSEEFGSSPNENRG